MSYGFDARPAEHACCAAKTWLGKNVSAGIMLYVFGTTPDPNAICTDAHKQAINLIRVMLMEKLEEITSGIGANDVRYASMMLLDTLNDCNLRIRELRAFLGQGIYLGGTVIYTSARSCCVITFGGCSAYLWTEHSITRFGTPPDSHLIRDALGGREAWKPEVFQHSFSDADRGLLVVSAPNINAEYCLKQLVDGLRSDSQISHTPSILIRHEIEKVTGSPSAVLEFTCNGG